MGTPPPHTSTSHLHLTPPPHTSTSHLPLTLCDRPLGPLLLPLLLHQATLEQGAVSNAAAVATEDQQRRHAPLQELQHTRFPWQLARLALHQRHVLRHPPTTINCVNTIDQVCGKKA